jgi:Mrp family chromosome partitioning ATPase/capsular polysaccharide biosynthesis protein
MDEGQQPAPDARRRDNEQAQLREAPRYASLADYVRVIRRHRLLIMLVCGAFVAGALVYSLTRETVYEAEAQVSFRDVLADLGLIGVDAGVPEIPTPQRAARNADLITRPEVNRIVAERLGDQIAGRTFSVNARVAVQTSLVIIETEAPDANLAAALANGYARAAKRVETREQLRRLEQARRAITDEIAEVESEGDDPARRVTASIRLSVLEQLLSRVETLEQISEPVEIVRDAVPPASRASPNPARDAVLGAVVGLVLGILAAFVRDSLDRRLHTAREVHDELGVPVLSRVSETALGYAGLVGNGQPPMREADFEPFRVLRMNLRALRGDPPPRTIAVTSGLPEEGKSTVSMALASAAAIAGQSVLLVECDLRRPSFARRLGIAREPGLTDYLLGVATPQQILRSVELAQPTVVNGAGPSPDAPAAGVLTCIAAGRPVINAAELLVSARFGEFVESVTDAYELVVFDTSPLLSVVDPLELVPHMDALLFCVRAQRTTRDQVRAARAALANLADLPTGAVLTGLRRGGPDSYDYYYGY